MPGVRLVKIRIPAPDGFYRPGTILVCVARQANIRAAGCLRHIRPGHHETVLPPVIDSHKRGFGHMAAHALRTLAVAGMMVVIRGIVVTIVVALGTDAIAFNLELAGMGVMAVATDNT